MKTHDLKPCPFCGGEAEIGMDNYGKIMIWCAVCRLQFGIEIECGEELVDGWRAAFATQEEAVEAWNRRYDNE